VTKRNTKATNSSETKWAMPTKSRTRFWSRRQVVKFTADPDGEVNRARSPFQFRLEGDGQLYVCVDKGLKARSGYGVAGGAREHRQCEFCRRSNQRRVLALGGERKLSIRIARRPGDQIEIDRVLRRRSII